MRTLIALFAAASLTGCTPVFFQPSGTLYATPGLYGLDYQPVELQAGDGTKLFAWFMPARGAPKATVLYLHGNAENISTHFANVAWMPAAGFNVLALDYRGYGGSAGKPTLARDQPHSAAPHPWRARRHRAAAPFRASLRCRAGAEGPVAHSGRGPHTGAARSAGAQAPRGIHAEPLLRGAGAAHE